MSEPRKGVITFDITVSGGVGEGPLCQANHLANFCMKCDDSAMFKLIFEDRDGFQVYGARTDEPGALSGPINLKCYDFKLKMKEATDGVYNFRVHTNN